MTAMDDSKSDQFLFSLAGRVRNLGFSPSPINSLFPLFEAIANALHSIEERFERDAAKKGKIVIEFIRKESEEDSPPILGFIVTDNGTGLKPVNWAAFRTADTAQKIKRGGKGVGRLSWLKVFQNTEISSIFDDDGKRWSRQFGFAINEAGSNPVSNHRLAEAPDAQHVGTRIHLEPFVDDYAVHCPRRSETIASHIIGHFLSYFVSYEAPTFIMKDGASEINLLDFYSEHVVAEHHDTIKVTFGDPEETQELDMFHVLLEKGLRFHDAGKHWLLYVGDGRAVKQEKIDNQLGLGYVGDEGNCIYVGLVAGNFLNTHVNQERTRFTFADEMYDDIHGHSVAKSKEYLSEYIEKLRNKQAESTLKVIKESPQFLTIVEDVNQFVRDNLSLNTQSEEDIFLELSRRRRRHQREIKRDIKSLPSLKDSALNDRVAKIADAINAENKGSLAEYVVRRKEILDILDSSIAYADQNEQKYLKEEVVHSLIIPIRSDSESLEYDDHNLWILDDRLAFYSFFKSDKPFKTFLTDSDSRKEPDVAVVFDRSLAFDREGTDEPIVIVEFKRPGRTQYGPADNPVTQVLDYVKIFRRGGSYADRTGKIRKSIPESTRFLCFVVADFTDGLVDMLETSIAQHKSTDGEGYFGFSAPHNAFVEVLPYSKLLHDARLRNEAFFRKLGLL